MSKELLKEALEAALNLLEYEHEEYTEARRRWGEGNPHRWERLKDQADKTNSLVNRLRDAVDARHTEAELATGAPQAQPAADLTDAEILEAMHVGQEDPTKEGWISRQRVRQGRAVLAAQKGKP